MTQSQRDRFQRQAATERAGCSLCLALMMACILAITWSCGMLGRRPLITTCTLARNQRRYASASSGVADLDSIGGDSVYRFKVTPVSGKSILSPSLRNTAGTLLASFHGLCRSGNSLPWLANAGAFIREVNCVFRARRNSADYEATIRAVWNHRGDRLAARFLSPVRVGPIGADGFYAHHRPMLCGNKVQIYSRTCFIEPSNRRYRS